MTKHHVARVTGWSRRWELDEYRSEGPYLTQITINRIVEAEPRLVGVDFSNVDDPTDPGALPTLACWDAP